MKTAVAKDKAGPQTPPPATGKKPRPAPAAPEIDAALVETTMPDRATDKVINAISDGIRTGLFVPGQHLLEPDLTRRLGVSRGSLREGLKHLAAAGIVTLNRFRGAYIAELDRKSVFDLIEAFEPLARLAARLAAQRCDTPEKEALLIASSGRIEAASKTSDRAAYIAERRTFYDVLLEIGENRELARIMPLIRLDLVRVQVEMIQTEQQRKKHSAGYARITKAILNRDPGGAERAMGRHFEGARKLVLELPLRAFGSESAEHPSHA